LFYISASRLKRYEECRASYHAFYNLGYRQEANTSALAGSAVHKAIEEWYRNGCEPVSTHSTLMHEGYERLMVEEESFKEFDPFQTLLLRGETMLREFPFDRFTPVALEKNFDVPLTDDIRVHGFIDMMVADGLIDFKTSKNKPRNLKKDIQFILYVYAYKQLTGTYPKKVIWYHLRTQEEIPFELDASYETELARVIELAETLRDDPFLEFEMCPKCPRWCIARKAGIV
jgi:ATP-dependent exoDNAse (exonuclease V) beta subunit